ncbi:mitochondrial inner membrane translocase subunit Tim17/Tim22/Tim23/peroxisomal protein PMP24 [Lipomyces tetrasporus]|uniref:Mitochondrial inner membrane translocase subunit Tim17/Tim22/Tim23/peroxisomal protein PMP24 n=1 Tax=Lipomyces tetrasporus TaxID=54092 RepID=A0AAD7VWN9_9ASCO|nr:mitochondrial inner membrane translocase subunit Tim17/Tim22/Tim23/peroxisomal protein PMP24 [Lipomyces tetrasporus]KAJ8104229.1 mitochondrial inner membrane translocase subunit Tim17/Tim22/Tim23/peroxisomal protein PMP24 [Lipomyces tetrasporus]
MADHTRDPCPIVIVNDFGGAFSMGVIGGTIWHGIKGFRNSPSQLTLPEIANCAFIQGERRSGAIAAIRSRAPVVGGNFGSWGGVFSIFDCAIKGIRRKEDPFNPILAGFCTGGALAMRGGFKHARNSAITCGCLLAVFEGVGIAMSSYMSRASKPQLPDMEGGVPLAA